MSGLVALDDARAARQGWQHWRNDDGRRQGWSRAPRTFAQQLRHACDRLDAHARLTHQLVAVAAAKRAEAFRRHRAKAAAA